MYSPEGQYVSRLNGAKLVGPKGVCAQRDGRGGGRVAVVDNRGCTVAVYDVSGTEGRQTGRLGTRGSGDDQLSAPQYCAFMPVESAELSPSVVVTDFHTHTVKVCSSD